MKFPVNRFAALVFSAAFFISGCGKTIIDPVEPEVIKPGEISIHFENRFGENLLELNKMLPLTGSDSVKITALEYFISNVELVQANGTRFKEPYSYHLIQVKPGLTRDEFLVKNVPPGDYTKVLFQIGIDAARNSNPNDTIGDLGANPALAWLNSYIFLQTTGFYYDAAATNKQAPFHFETGRDAALRYVTLPFATTITINDAHKPEMHLFAAVKKLFTSPNVLDIKSNPEITDAVSDEADASRLSDNAANIFSINHIHTR